jgi:hypothetical protein
VKHILGATFEKKALIIRVGEELEKVVSNPRSIGGLVKDALKEETNDKLISVRTIEMLLLFKVEEKDEAREERKNFVLSATE